MKVRVTSRILLAMGSISLAIGAAFHCSGSEALFSSLAQSRLSPEEVKGLRALWHSDTLTQALLALGFAWISAFPKTASRNLILLFALIPLATAISLYSQLGPYVGGHSLMVSFLLIALGSLGFSKTES